MEVRDLEIYLISKELAEIWVSYLHGVAEELNSAWLPRTNQASDSRKEAGLDSGPPDYNYAVTSKVACVAGA